MDSTIKTFTGRYVNPLDLKPEDIDIEDIAHALSNQCRFSGHTRRFWSVGQHSVLVSHAVPQEDALWGLLHDASEAYLVDMPRPLKRCAEFGPIYRKYETGAMGAISKRFGLPWPEPETVRLADSRILLDEKLALMGSDIVQWDCGDGGSGPLGININPLSPDVAEVYFLDRFYKLSGLPWSSGAIDGTL